MAKYQVATVVIGKTRFFRYTDGLNNLVGYGSEEPGRPTIIKPTKDKVPALEQIFISQNCTGNQIKYYKEKKASF